jgi:hypothetical protein
MPYESKAQRGLFHSKNAPVSKKVVEEFDKASKGQKNLPEHVKKGKKSSSKSKGKGKMAGKKGCSCGDCPISYA